MGVNVKNGMPARYLATPPTLVDGQGSALMVDVNGKLLVSATFSGASIAIDELPAAAALSDTFANPTTTSIAAMNMIYNGSTWARWKDDTAFGDDVTSGIPSVALRVYDGTNYDRLRGDVTNGMDVDVTRILPGTSATSLGKAEDAAHVSGDVGVMDLGVANEAQTVFAADGDYIPRAADTKGNTVVVGSVASAATDATAPVKVGAKVNTTRPTFTDGQRGDLQIGVRGSLGVEIWGAGTTTAAAAMVASDGQGNGNAGLVTVGRNNTYNGATWDMLRGNIEASILTSAVRATTTNGADQTNFNGRGALLTINITVEAATETLSLKIQGKDSISGNYSDIVDFGVVYNATTDAPTSTRSFAVYPGILSADFVGITGNGTSGKAGLIGRTWRPVVTHSASGNWTYSLSTAVIS